MESKSLVGSVPLVITEILSDMTEEEAKAQDSLSVSYTHLTLPTNREV